MCRKKFFNGEKFVASRQLSCFARNIRRNSSEKKGENFAQCYQLNCILKIHIFPYFLSYLLSGCSGDYNHHLNLKRSISD